MVLAQAVHRRGDLERAEATYEESLSLSRQRSPDLLTIAGCLAGLARIAAGHGNQERAARLFGAAGAALERASTDESPADSIDRERTAAIVRAAQGAFGREAEWAAGGSMSPRQATAYVLE
jgi:ATP/maltotriose-dependent transcriptional regulator MalT